MNRYIIVGCVVIVIILFIVVYRYWRKISFSQSGGAVPHVSIFHNTQSIKGNLDTKLSSMWTIINESLAPLIQEEKITVSDYDCGAHHGQDARKIDAYIKLSMIDQNHVEIIYTFIPSSKNRLTPENVVEWVNNTLQNITS